MTIKKNLENEIDTRWRRKGGSHRVPEVSPKVCSNCNGRGLITSPSEYMGITECPVCEGTGEVW